MLNSKTKVGIIDSKDYWKPIIEPASPEEIAMAEERIKDYERAPSSFTPLSSVK